MLLLQNKIQKLRYFTLTKQVEITNRDGHILRGIVNIPEKDAHKIPCYCKCTRLYRNKSGYKNIYTHTARLLAEQDLPVSVLIYTEMAKVTVSSRT